MRTTHGSVVHAADPPAAARLARGRAPPRRRRDRRRQDEHARVRLRGLHRQLAVRRHPEPVDARLLAGRIERRSGGRARRPGMAPLATGTDGGGSIRIPAAFCGLAGLKPTNGLIGRSPIPSWIDLSTSGPMATTVTDLALLLGVMKGPVAGDPTAHPAWSPRMGVWPRRAVVAERLGSSGGLIARRRHHLPGIARPVLARDRPVAGAGRPRPAVRRRRPRPRTGSRSARSNSCTPSGVAAWTSTATSCRRSSRTIMELASRIDFDTYLDAKRRRFEYVRAFDDLLGDDTVLLSPTMCVEGFPADGVMPGADHAGTPPEVYNTRPREHHRASRAVGAGRDLLERSAVRIADRRAEVRRRPGAGGGGDVGGGVAVGAHRARLPAVRRLARPALRPARRAATA